MKPVALLICVASLILAFVSEAAAALEVRLKVSPEVPRVGDTSLIQLRPYWPFTRADGTCCDLRPAKVQYPFRLELVAPGGRIVRTAVVRTSNPHIWIARVTFDKAGRWIVREPHWGPTYRAAPTARPRISVSVRR